MPRWQSCNKTVLMPCCWRNGCCAWYLGTKRSCWYVRWFHGDFNKIAQDWTIICRVCRWFMLLCGFLRIFSRVGRVQNDQLFGRAFFHTGFNPRNVEVWPANMGNGNLSQPKMVFSNRMGMCSYVFTEPLWVIAVIVTVLADLTIHSILGKDQPPKNWPFGDPWFFATMTCWNESDDGNNYQTPQKYAYMINLFDGKAQWFLV